MSRKTPLTSQTTHVEIVIRKNVKIPLSTIKNFCIDYATRYAFIEHEHDVHPDTGEIEGVHYHIVVDLAKSKTPLSTVLNNIVKYFRFNDSVGIEIQKYDTFEKSLQYLIHKNNPEKTQHNKSEIIHNLSSEDFEILINCEIGNVITFDLLYVSCNTANNIIEVIKVLGINNYRTYRSVIWDMWNTLNKNPDYMKRR